MSDWIKACNVDGCPPGRMIFVKAGDKEIVLANSKGIFSANARHCTHRGAPLEEGMLKDNVLTCPWHGAEFDVRSGKVLMMPAPTDLEHFEVKVENGEVFVKV